MDFIEQKQNQPWTVEQWEGVLWGGVGSQSYLSDRLMDESGLVNTRKTLPSPLYCANYLWRRDDSRAVP